VFHREHDLPGDMHPSGLALDDGLAGNAKGRSKLGLGETEPLADGAEVIH
jgi:hypothetical protein